MYYMLQAKVDRLAGNILSEETPKTPKSMYNFSNMLTLEVARGQTDDTRSTFRVPLKTLGCNGSN